MQAKLPGHNSSVFVANRALANSSRSNQDYLSCRPAFGTDRAPTPKRLRVPDPLRTLVDNRTPLSAGPAGYRYTDLCSRTPDLESFRYDHGIRFKRRISLRAVIFSCGWNLLYDEDAWPLRMSEKCVDFLKSVNGSLKRRIVDCAKTMSRFWNVSKKGTTECCYASENRTPSATRYS